MTDLSLVPIKDMLEEIKKRYDHVVFAALKVNGRNLHDENETGWHGHSGFCVGLAMNIIREIHDWERDGKGEGGV